ncbi:hypothetical protein SBV1_780004 [Verrucomicrobia bacterium]|nr:hypothetical protein SBV1_780004 [Verrucomicrobiota bacterium]
MRPARAKCPCQPRTVRLDAGVLAWGWEARFAAWAAGSGRWLSVQHHIPLPPKARADWNYLGDIIHTRVDLANIRKVAALDWSSPNVPVKTGRAEGPMAIALVEGITGCLALALAQVLGGLT